MSSETHDSRDVRAADVSVGDVLVGWTRAGETLCPVVLAGPRVFTVREPSGNLKRLDRTGMVRVAHPDVVAHAIRTGELL